MTRRATSRGTRSVIQERHARRLHWDCRLERDGVLVSWALPTVVPDDPKRNLLAVHVGDHALDSIDFEVEIPAGGYGAGRLMVWFHGQHRAEKFLDDEVMLTLAGTGVSGRYSLFRVDGDRWLMHRMDPPTEPAAEPMPTALRPMLATLGSLPADGRSPFVRGKPPRGSTFIEPELVVDVEFNEWRNAGTLRHASFKGVREEIAARAVVRKRS